MKTIRLIAFVAVLGACLTARAQSTPQAIVDAIPERPAPAQWVAGQTGSFKARMDELAGRIAQLQMAALTPNVSQTDLEKAQAILQQQQDQFNAQTKELFGVDFREEVLSATSEADLQARMMAGVQQVQRQAQQMQADIMDQYQLTEADLKKMENMSDEQIEAYMTNHLRQKGITPPQEQALTPEEEARERREQARAEALGLAIRSREVFLQLLITTRELMVAEVRLFDKQLATLDKGYEAIIPPAQNAAGQAFDRRAHGMGGENAEALQAQADKFVNDYRLAAYRIQANAVSQGQERLKKLLPFAEQADKTQQLIARLTGTGVESVDRLQALTTHGLDVAAQYLSLTASEPSLKW